MYPTVYKRDTKGKIRIWRMEQDGANYRTISGLQDGKQITTEWTTAEPKNTGRANATTAEEQAIAEIEANYAKRTKREYFHSIEAHDLFVESNAFFKPMLADKWHERKAKISYPVWIQPKFDGIRCIATKDGLFSRTGEPIVAVPHIWESIKDLFLVDDAMVLDGELYNHDLYDDFNEITSLVKKTKPKPEDIEKAAGVIQYHVYDCFNHRHPNSGFLTRHGDINAVIGTCRNMIQLVTTVKCDNEQQVDTMYENFLNKGYEGGMIRTDGVAYENKRSKTLLKRKDFEDEEFEIIRIEEGKGNLKGYAAKCFFRNNQGECGEVSSGIMGKRAFCKEVWENADQYVGKKVTIQYQGRTPGACKPRFPKAKALHLTERW